MSQRHVSTRSWHEHAEHRRNMLMSHIRRLGIHGVYVVNGVKITRMTVSFFAVQFSFNAIVEYRTERAKDVSAIADAVFEYAASGRLPAGRKVYRYGKYIDVLRLRESNVKHKAIKRGAAVASDYEDDLEDVS